MTIWCVVFLAPVSGPLQSPTAWRFLVWDHCVVFVNIRHDRLHSLMMSSESYVYYGHPPVCTFWRDVRVLILSGNWAHWQVSKLHVFFLWWKSCPSLSGKDQRWREALCLLEANRLELFVGVACGCMDVWERGIRFSRRKGDYLP